VSKGPSMKYASLLPLATLTTTFAVGQAVYQKPLQIDPRNCPVGLQVRHGGGLPVAVGTADPVISGKLKNGEVPSVQNQGIHLTLANLGSRDIVGLEITVHGLSEKWRNVPLSDVSPEADIAKTVYLSFDVKRSGHASRDLSLSRFTAVTSVDVNSIKYTDGSEWHAPSADACSVTPDLIMLVASR
jgi:hypothetical protein